jgi:hypothetical protein
MKVRSEHVEQREFVMWMRQQTPYLIYAIPNGGHKTDGAKLKCEGVLAGMPDLHVPELRLWIEMKRRDGKARESQEKIHARLRAFGDVVEVCNSKEAAMAAVQRIMSAMKAPSKKESE